MGKYPFMIVIEAEKSKYSKWKELWESRELILFLTWRDLLVRYKQTIVGVVWHFLKPLMMLLTLTLVFGRLAHLDTGKGYPYVILVMTGLLPWQFFSTTLSDCSESLVVNYQLITKIYFPRIILPISSIIVTFVDFMISLLLLGGLLCYYQFIPSYQIIFLPLFIALLLLLSFGLGIWSAAVNVRYRDCRQLVPFAIQFGLYLSPVGFSSQIVPDDWQLIYHLNPIAGVIDGFRWSIIGPEETLSLPAFFVSLMVIIGIFCSGLWYYRSVEKYFADII